MVNEKKSCVAIWFSGFFALGAVMHLVRSIVRFPLVVGTFEVPISLSVVLAVVLGVLSLSLLCLACRKSCCEKHGNSG